MKKRDRSFDIFIIDVYDPSSHDRRHRSGEDNGYAHLKRQIMRREVVVAVAKTRWDQVSWKQGFDGEFNEFGEWALGGGKAT